MAQQTTLPPAPDSPKLPSFSVNLQGLLIPFLAIFTAILIGSVLILLAGLDPIKAYTGLLQGAFGTDAAITRSLVKMAPLIFAGLSVAVAFKGGLFNIGAQGQLVMGSLFAAWVGFGVAGLPPALHVILALLAGAIGGALWGMIPGLLKAYTGAHEVIVTIMLNYIATLLLEWAVAPFRPSAPAGPLAACQTAGSCAIGQTPEILPSAVLGGLYTTAGNSPETLHLGVFLAIFAAIIVFIVVYRTTFGFELRMVGLNPNAAKYAGINVTRMTVLTMMIAGLLAGLAGAIQTLGVNYRFQVNQSLTIGFDSIAVSLLASNNPLAVIPSSLLFGALAAGGTQMQSVSRVPADLIQVVQALILMFVAADGIIRGLYRIKGSGDGSNKVKLSTGWGQR
jgi:simple sugar transport system permease protein